MGAFVCERFSAPSGAVFLLPAPMGAAHQPKGGSFLESRLSVISILVEDRASSAKINDLLHDCGEYIVGRMGLPYKERGLSVICVVIDAPGDVTSALSGKLGMLPGVTAKTVTSKAPVLPKD